MKVNIATARDMQYSISNIYVLSLKPRRQGDPKNNIYLSGYAGLTFFLTVRFAELSTPVNTTVTVN